MKFRVRKLAEERGLDAAKLARRADLNYNTVAVFWNSDDVPPPNPRASTLEAIAKALNVSIGALFEEDRTESPGIRAPECLALAYA